VPIGVAVTFTPAVGVRVGVPIAGVAVRVGVDMDDMAVGVRVGVVIAAVGLGLVWARPATATDTARQKPKSVFFMSLSLSSAPPPGVRLGSSEFERPGRSRAAKNACPQRRYSRWLPPDELGISRGKRLSRE
jgi:hypothetical protein